MPVVRRAVGGVPAHSIRARALRSATKGIVVFLFYLYPGVGRIGGILPTFTRRIGHSLEQEGPLRVGASSWSGGAIRKRADVLRPAGDSLLERSSGITSKGCKRKKRKEAGLVPDFHDIGVRGVLLHALDAVEARRLGLVRLAHRNYLSVSSLEPEPVLPGLVLVVFELSSHVVVPPCVSVDS